jgi:mannosyl-oligosaccharide alpha-1,2-mannosidase
MAAPLTYKLRKYRWQLALLGLFVLFLYNLDSRIVSSDFPVKAQHIQNSGGHHISQPEPNSQAPTSRDDASRPSEVHNAGGSYDEALHKNHGQERLKNDQENSEFHQIQDVEKNSENLKLPGNQEVPEHPKYSEDQKSPQNQMEEPSEVDEDDWEFIGSGSESARVNGNFKKVPLPAYSYPRKEKYPVDKVMDIPPPGPKLRTIQADFAEPESHTARAIRLQRLEKVKQVFETAYGQYKRVGWGDDEIRPVTERSFDPFLGWAATLVDALDTMHIMGLKNDFKEAVDFVAGIDFRSTFRSSIPLFETVIRYLGGLIAAYDLSGRTEKVLLDKAVELADNLMGAFDTPNRMPLAFYKWQDLDTKTRWRAGTDTSFAELGSLTLEFTHLAQLTKDNKYYDAVARITDALYAFAPNTQLPWLMPQVLDLSGCNVSTTGKYHGSANSPGMAVDPSPYRPVDAANGGRTTFPRPLYHQGESEALRPPAKTVGDAVSGSQEIDNGDLLKRAVIPLSIDQDDLTKYPKVVSGGREGYCLPQGLASGARYRTQEVYSLGGSADSSYEYYMKTFQLLKGGDSRYIELYENMVKAAKQHLVFKPWVANNKDILFVGNKKINVNKVIELNEMSHLTCFAGGMFALGGKLLDRAEDVELGKKITEGCVWAYNSTRTGIMPERFNVRRCPADSPDCVFDMTTVFDYDEIHPPAPNRPHTTFIDEEGGGQRWGVSKMYDMPRSFLTGDPRYLLRPEAIESVFYMYRITGDQTWQEKGWTMFENILRATEVVNVETGEVQGYTAIKDVTSPIQKADDSAESFWLAETLKYFYLLFEEPSVISLDDYVLNTEAHPFKI